MAFQFQSVAAVAPLLNGTFGVSLADIGLLIGLYFAPGIVLALPGGAIGRKLGDKKTVLAALLLMLIGELAMALSPFAAASQSFCCISGPAFFGFVINYPCTCLSFP